MAGGGPWARLAAALAPPAPPALRRPRPSLRHQTELLLLLLERPGALCGGPGDPGGPGGPEGPGGALLALLAEPPAPPAPPRALLLLAALSVLAFSGDRAGTAALAALLQRPGGAGGAPAAAAECLRELRRLGTPGNPPRALRSPGDRRESIGTPGDTPRALGTPGKPPRALGSPGDRRESIGTPAEPPRAIGTPGDPLGTPQSPPGDPLGSPAETPALQPLVLLRAESAADPANPWEEAGPDPGPPFLLAPAARAQLLQLRGPGGPGALGAGTPPLLAAADPAPVQAALLGGGLGLGGLGLGGPGSGGPGLEGPGSGGPGLGGPGFGGRRLALLALHPALPPPLRLFFLLCLLQGGDPQNPAAPPPPGLPPALAAALIPGGGPGEPPELFLPRFEAAAAFWSQISESPLPKVPGGRDWLWGLVEFLGGGPPVLFCRAVLSFRRRFGGLPEPGLGAAAEKLLGRGHPAAPPHLLELAKALGGSPGGALMARVLREPPPPPGTPELRGVLRVLRGGGEPGTPPQIGPRLRGYLRRALAAGGGSWGGAQGVLSAAAPLLPLGGVPPCPPGAAFGEGGDPDVRDRARLHWALGAALGPPKLAAVLGPPPRRAPRPPTQNGPGGGPGGGAPPSLLPAPPPCSLRVLPGPLPPFPAPPGAPQDPEGWGGALLAGGGRPVPLPLRLRLEPLRGSRPEGTPPQTGGEPPPTSGTPPQIGDQPPPAPGTPPQTGGETPPASGSPPQIGDQPPSPSGTPPQFGDEPPPVLALQVLLWGGGGWAEGALPALGGGRGGGGGAELTLTLRPPRALPPSLEAAAVFSPGGAPRGGGGAPREGGGVSLLAPLPPLELPLGAQLRPLALPPPWDPPRALRAFEALWGSLGGGPETLLVLGGGGAAPPPALAPLLVPGAGGGGAGGGWALAAAAPPRGVVLARGGPGGEGRVRGQRWGGVLLLARLLRGEGPRCRDRAGGGAGRDRSGQVVPDRDGGAAERYRAVS